MSSSALKRKRGPEEVLESLKCTKSSKKTPKTPLEKPEFSQGGWEAALNAPPPKTQELVETNGIHYDDFVAEEKKEASRALEVANDRKQKKEWRKLMKKVISVTESNDWKLSEPIGGRQMDIDPVFTQDEKFLILANRTTIHVYSTSNSLLTRSISLRSAIPGAQIVAYCLSETNSNIIWVACSDGSIYSIDWTSGKGADQSWTISSTGCLNMTVASMESAGKRRDVVFTTEPRKDGGWRITANELARPGDSFETGVRTIYTSNTRIKFLKTASEGSVILASSGRKVLLGSLRSTEYGTVASMRYEFRVFESTQSICSMDAKVSSRTGTESLGKSTLRRMPVVDVVVGDVKGSIFVHNDLLGNLARSQEEKAVAGINLIPRKLHWHRREVCTVKWSQDGNYIISGGWETVLVLWQLDTGKKQFLPHMSATIQNLVVSPSGTSYGVQLGDNSTMVLSVAELKPTANISGIQTTVLSSANDIGAYIDRVEEDRDELPFIQRTPAAISSTDPSRLLVGVGQNQQTKIQKPLVSSISYLQTFDLGSGHSISRQAFTRSNETNVNITPIAGRISEPRITLMKLSYDGQWLATVDEWTPSTRDVDFMAYQGKSLADERRSRREVFLKFWQLNHKNDIWELVSRIDAPHSFSDSLAGAGRILDLASDSSSLRFSTIGEDGIVRTWVPKTRKRSGVIVRGEKNEALRSWVCQHTISTGKQELSNESQMSQRPTSNGCVAFSEDGSLLAAACGDNGILHLIDPQFGGVRISKTSLFHGEIIQAEFSGRDIILLSNHLQVYDLVADEIRYSIALAPTVTDLSIAQKNEMIHLAVDRQSRTFAVALPSAFSPVTETLEKKFSELSVFDQDNTEPLLQATFPTLITALLPAVGSDGYLVLDSAAEIRTISRNGSQAVITQALPTSDQQLDSIEESNGDLLGLLADDAEVDEMEGIEEKSEDVEAKSEDGEDEEDARVVSQQQLSAIFDIGPSFALPPMEEMFYQVAGLYTSLPLALRVS